MHVLDKKTAICHVEMLHPSTGTFSECIKSTTSLEVAVLSLGTIYGKYII